MYLFELVFLFSSDIYPEVEFLDCRVAVFLMFSGTSILFSIVADQLTISPTVYGGSLFSTSTPTLEQGDFSGWGSLRKSEWVAYPSLLFGDIKQPRERPTSWAGLLGPGLHPAERECVPSDNE